MILNKICVFICNDKLDQAIFIKALNDVSPETICFCVCNPHDALYMMAKENITPTFVITELNMQEMDGIQFLKTIKGMETLKNIPVIVHSTSPQPHKIIELKESGALAIYFRPYEYYSICNMLNLFLDTEMVISQN